MMYGVASLLMITRLSPLNSDTKPAAGCTTSDEPNTMSVSAC